MQPSPPTSPSSPRRRPADTSPTPRPPLYGPSPAPRRSDGTPPQRRVRTPEGRPQASCPGRVLVVSTPWIAELADGRPGSPPSEPAHHRRRSPFGRGATCHQPRRRSRGRPRARPPRRRDHGAPLHRGCGGARRARPGTRRGWRPGARGRRARRRGGGARPGADAPPPPGVTAYFDRRVDEMGLRHGREPLGGSSCSPARPTSANRNRHDGSSTRPDGELPDPVPAARWRRLAERRDPVGQAAPLHLHAGRCRRRSRPRRPRRSPGPPG